MIEGGENEIVEAEALRVMWNQEVDRRTEIELGEPWAGNVIAGVEPAEQEIVWVFMQYGRWRPVEPEAILDNDRLLALEYRWDPLEPSNQGFEVVGTLSEMFAAYYAEQTIDSGKVVQICAPLRPNWLEPLVSLNTTKRRLPLWTFALVPNFEGLADE